MARQQAAEVDPYEGLRTRARWKRADAERVVRDWTQSGESMTGFARRHRVGLHRLHYWREQVGADGSSAESVVRLVRAVVRSAPSPTVEARMGAAVCVVAGGVRIELSEPHGTDPQWVASLVLGLRGVLG